MTRWVLNHVPNWALGLIFVTGVVLLALGGLALVRRFLPSWRDERSRETVVGVAAMVMTVFALLLAFVIVNLYDSYEGAVRNVAAEATSLTELVHDAQALPPTVRPTILRAVARYVVDVRTREFPAQRRGDEDPRTQQQLTSIVDALASYSPVTTAQQSFYQAATEQVHTIVSERESRLDAADTSIPGPLLQLMILFAVLTLGISLLIQTHHPPLDAALIVTIAVVVGAALLTALILQYPFSGSIAATSDPFNSGVLADLTRAYP